MKRKLLKIICTMIVLLSAVKVFAKESNSMYVSTETLTLKQKASAFSKDLTKLNYGDEVCITEEDKSWVCVYSVSNPNVKGWVPLASLTKKKILTGAKKTSADAKEVALAGKGFNSTIEAVYSEEYNIDYKLVDFVESNSVAYAELLDFINKGGLNGGSDKN